MSTRRIAGTRTFPAQAARVTEARSWVGSCCADGGVDAETGDAVRLLASEVITNAIIHTASPRIAVEVVIEAHAVEVSVADDDPDPPRPRDAAPTDPGGRGLTLVRVLSEQWGTRGGTAGKCVWFRVRRLAE